MVEEFVWRRFKANKRGY